MGSTERWHNDRVSKVATDKQRFHPVLSCVVKIAVLVAACLAVQTPTYAATPTSVSITASAVTVVSGESFQLTISVNAEATSGLPTGTISLYDGTKQLGSFNILTDANTTAAQVQLTTTPQLAGPYTLALSAVYSGDSVFAPGTSPILNVDVAQSDTNDTIQMMWVGQQALPSTNTGTAQDVGVAGYASSSTVSYSNQTETGPCSFYCDLVDVALAATPDTVAEGQELVLRASVIDIGFGTAPVFAAVQSGYPTGTVTFREGSTVLGGADLTSVTDSNGNVTSQAVLTLSTLSPGEHRITVDFAGDGTHEAGSSPELSVTVLIPSSAPPAVSTPVVPTVASFSGPTATGSGMSKVEFSGGGEECTFSKSAYLPVPDKSDAAAGALTVPDAKLSFPHGLVDFTASGCIGGATLKFTLTLPSVAPAGATLYKYGPTFENEIPHWYPFPASFDGKTVTFSVTDGGLGDDDLTANGVIVDPSGVAVPGVASGDTSSQSPSANPPSSGGGSFDPLSLCALLIFGLLTRMHFHCARVCSMRPLA